MSGADRFDSVFLFIYLYFLLCFKFAPRFFAHGLTGGFATIAPHRRELSLSLYHILSGAERSERA